MALRFIRLLYVMRCCSSELIDTKVTHRENRDGLYDISATATFPPDTEIESPSEFVCELRIPEANYTVRKEYVYYEGEDNSCVFEDFKNVCRSGVIFILVL